LFIQFFVELLFLFLPGAAQLGFSEFLATQVELQECSVLSPLKEVKQLQFSQSRFVSGMKRPIVSSGELTIDSSDDEGPKLTWKTLEPFPDKVVISRSGFEIESATGEFKSYDSGRFRKIASLVLDIHTSNSSKQLSKAFDLKCFKESEGYRVSALPKSRSIGKYISTFELKGSDYPSEISLVDKRGDRTEIVFIRKKTG